MHQMVVAKMAPLTNTGKNLLLDSRKFGHDVCIGSRVVAGSRLGREHSAIGKHCSKRGEKELIHPETGWHQVSNSSLIARNSLITHPWT
jgi:hypothetical protein